MFACLHVLFFWMCHIIHRKNLTASRRSYSCHCSIFFCNSIAKTMYQRWSRGHKARDQGQGHKKIPGQAKDSPSEDRHSRGQEQECSRPRPRTNDTSASALQRKRSSPKFFRPSPEKNVFQKIFQELHKILTIQKMVLSSSRR